MHEENLIELAEMKKESRTSLLEREPRPEESRRDAREEAADNSDDPDLEDGFEDKELAHTSERAMMEPDSDEEFVLYDGDFEEAFNNEESWRSVLYY